MSLRISSMLGMAVAFKPALTFHLFKSVLLAFPSSQLRNYGATLFSLRDEFTEQFQMAQNSVSCQFICSNNGKTIYIVDFYSLMRQYECKNNNFTKNLKYFSFKKLLTKQLTVMQLLKVSCQYLLEVPT